MDFFLLVHGGGVGGCRGGGGSVGFLLWVICGFMVVKWGVAVVMVVAWPWVSGLRFLGLPW